jgi:hypothetical protein
MQPLTLTTEPTSTPFNFGPSGDTKSSVALAAPVAVAAVMEVVEETPLDGRSEGSWTSGFGGARQVASMVEPLLSSMV